MESYWQIGCNDGRQRKPHQFPDRYGLPTSPANASYANGYNFGTRQQYIEDHHESFYGAPPPQEPKP